MYYECVTDRQTLKYMINKNRKKLKGESFCQQFHQQASHIGWQKKKSNSVDNKSHNEIRSGKKSLK